MTMNRRRFLLAAGAVPTVSTPDVHNYLEFLTPEGIPQVAPAGKWEPSHRDILGPYYAPNAPFRGKVTAPLDPGEPALLQGRPLQ
jgi:hypothetical protein